MGASCHLFPSLPHWFIHVNPKDFIEFQTNECVSDDKETINRSIQKSSTVVVVVPGRFEDLLHRQSGERIKTFVLWPLVGSDC